MTPGTVLCFLIAQGQSSAGTHRFLWIPMSTPVFWIVIAAVTIGIGLAARAVIRARRRRH